MIETNELRKTWPLLSGVGPITQSQRVFINSAADEIDNLRLLCTELVAALLAVTTDSRYDIVEKYWIERAAPSSEALWIAAKALAKYNQMVKL